MIVAFPIGILFLLILICTRNKKIVHKCGHCRREVGHRML